MALRNILMEGDPTLLKKSRIVTDFNERLHILIDDMRETLLDSGGVGLAAPQVGVLRRVVLVLETNVDIENGEEEYIIELINPEIIASDGSQTGPEGCLSLPGVYGVLSRPEYVKIRAQDRNGVTFEVEGFDLTARAFCHELDHLDGILFTELTDRLLSPEELAALSEQDAESEE